MAALTVLELMRLRGVNFSGSFRLMRSWMVRCILRKPLRICSPASSPMVRTRLLPRWSMSSAWPLPALRARMYLMALTRSWGLRV